MRLHPTPVLITILLCLSGCGSREGGASAAQSSGTRSTPSMTIPVVTEAYPPYSLEREDRIEGISTEVVQAIFREAGLQPGIRLMPWVRAYESARTTPGMLIYSISRTRERESSFVWIGTIAPYDVSLFAHSSRADIKAGPIGGMTHLRVGLVQGTSVIPWFEREGFSQDKNLDLSNSYEANVRKLLAGRIDILPTNRLLMQHILSTLGLPPDSVREVMPLPEVSSEGLWLAAHPKTDPRLVARLRTALARIRASGEYLKIINR